MKLAILLAGLALVLAAHADVTIVQTVEPGDGQSEDAPFTLTIRIKGRQGRVDVEKRSMTLLMDLEGDRLRLVDHGAQRVMQMPLAFLNSLAAAAALRPSAAAAPAPLRKTGRTRAIRGYACQEYGGVWNGTTTTCWMAEAPEAAELEPFRKTLATAIRSAGAGDWISASGLLVEAESRQTLRGVSVRTRLALQRLSGAPLADAVFAVPEGYTVTALPAGQGL